MRNLLVAALLAVGFLAANTASAGYDNCMDWDYISLNSGTGKKCLDDGGVAAAGSLCTASSQACQYAYVSAGACNSGYFETGMGTASGKKCCVRNCFRDEAEVQETRVEEVASTEQLQDVFQPRTSVYYGYVNNVVRSPSTGRGNSQTAKLDACIGHGETDMLGTNWSACYSKCDSSANGYCNSTGTNDGNPNTTAALCKDRCDCMITGWGSCENL